MDKIIFLISTVFFNFVQASGKPPLIVFMKSDVDFSYQTSALQVDEDTVEIITNSNFMFTPFYKVRIGSWTVSGPEVKSFIQSIESIKRMKVPVTKDNGGHGLRTWMLGDKVVLADHEISAFAGIIEGLLGKKEAKLNEGFEYDTFERKMSQTTFKKTLTHQCDSEAKTCKFGSLATIYLR